MGGLLLIRSIVVFFSPHGYKGASFPMPTTFTFSYEGKTYVECRKGSPPACFGILLAQSDQLLS